LQHINQLKKKKMKIKIEITKKDIVNALGKGVREIAISQGNGGFQRQTNVHKSKKAYNRQKSKRLDKSMFN